MKSNSQGRYLPRQRRRRRRHWGGFANVLMLFLAVGLLGAAVKTFVDGTEQKQELPILDTLAPRIKGVQNFLIYEGDAVDYRDGIIVTDNVDVEPVLTIDSSQADLSRAGEYQVVYTATDAAGNTHSEISTVTVLEKKEGYAALDTIYAAADERLAALLTEDMTVKQQVEAIYSWARSSLGYSGHMDKSDRFQAAYAMLTGGAGDCFGYYAVTKLMFDRLEIPNIDVRKVKNSEDDSDHYWSLVSVDGGETYYHFDATPRIGDGDDFCLVTDAFLDAYSAEHKNSHNRDTARYPATPEDAL